MAVAGRTSLSFDLRCAIARPLRELRITSDDAASKPTNSFSRQQPRTGVSCTAFERMHDRTLKKLRSSLRGRRIQRAVGRWVSWQEYSMPKAATLGAFSEYRTPTLT